MRTLVIRPLQGYGNTTSLSYPDTWERKPDCLHLPYSQTYVISSSKRSGRHRGRRDKHTGMPGNVEDNRGTHVEKHKGMKK